LKEGLLHDPISRGCEYPSRLVRLTPREASARVHCGRASAQFEFRGHFLPRTDDSQHPHRCWVLACQGAGGPPYPQRRSTQRSPTPWFQSGIL